MNKLLLVSFVLLCALCSYAEPMSGDAILALVRDHLPDDPLTLSGSLKVAKNRYVKSSLPVEMELDWGAETPRASYRIGEETLAITWHNNQPRYAFSNPANTPASAILDSGITWADLSFSVLWWPNARLVKEEKKINRDCYVVDVPVPASENTMRLWIEKKMGMLLEAQTLDARQKELRYMKIKSIKKLDGLWVAKDLEIDDRPSGTKTTLQINDLEWKNPMPALTAFDPAESVNQLSMELYQRLAAGQKGNLFLSPYSISSALAMTYGGARGETAAQMASTLHFGGPDATHPAFAYLRNTLNAIQENGHVQLNVANSLWPQKEYAFLPEYIALAKEFYGTEIEAVDFKADTEGARQKINTWVEAKTNDRIKDLIPEGMLDPATRLVLANAIYFKGNWARQFKTEATRPAPFNLADGSTVEVPMMSQTADFKLAHTDDFQALELPYEGGDLSMLILLPHQPNGLADLEQRLDLDTLYDLEFQERETMLQLPKFKLEWKFELSKTLAAMGMPLAFSDQADFSGLDGSRSLTIGCVIHQAFVEVNEEGTEAAAATAVGIKAMSMPPQFVADRPFLFLIRENTTGAILFIGRVMDPTR